MQTRQAVPVLILDLHALLGLFRTIAFAIEVQAGTHTGWHEYRDSRTLNIVYALMPWKGRPGWVEVTQDFLSIKAKANSRAIQIFETFLDKLSVGGPGSALAYAEKMVRLRDYSLQSVEELFRSANEINSDVINEIGQSIRTFTYIRFGSTLVVSGLSCGIAIGAGLGIATANAASAASGINLGYEITGTLIRNAQSADTAKAVGFALKKAGAEEIDLHLAEYQSGRAAQQIAAQLKDINRAKGAIEKANANLARNLGQAKRAKFNTRLNAGKQHLASAQSQLGAASWLRTFDTGAKIAIPLVFLALDVMEAVGELNENLKESR